jgi:hypothetical protein
MIIEGKFGSIRAMLAGQTGFDAFLRIIRD